MTLYITRPIDRMSRQMMKDMMRESYPEYERRLKMPVNVQVVEDAFLITALLPGIQAEDLNIQIVNETVTIQGELRKAENEAGDFLAHEIPFGKFQRTLSLPDALDSNKAEAELKDGVLLLRVPKAEEARPKTIQIKSKK
jgi:HSP20 family protein